MRDTHMQRDVCLQPILNHRHYMGEDLDSMNLKDLQNLEQQLDSALKLIRSRKVYVTGSFFNVSAAHNFARAAPMVPPTMGQPSSFPSQRISNSSGAPLIRGSHPYALLGMTTDMFVPCLGLSIAIACTVLSSSLTSPHACALGLCFARVGQPSILGLCLKRLS
ncbi:hypothetical protein BC332_27478 [Capsicum chinense]|nr:hypothetical protein BC332_27478 [Capsicum chinense]